MRLKSIVYAFIPGLGRGIRFRICMSLHELFRKYKWVFFGEMLKEFLLSNYGCEISINAKISPKAVFMHTVGIVIGEGCVIEEKVVLYSGVVLGRKNIYREDDYPVIKKGSILGTGAKVLGKIVVEQNTVIGAGAVVIESCTP